MGTKSQVKLLPFKKNFTQQGGYEALSHLAAPWTHSCPSWKQIMRLAPFSHFVHLYTHYTLTALKVVPSFIVEEDFYLSKIIIKIVH